MMYYWHHDNIRGSLRLETDIMLANDTVVHLIGLLTTVCVGGDASY